MKHLSKSFLTLLALTLFGGAGAWAQGPTQVTEITTDMIASWEGVNEYVTLADLQALGFVAVDASVAQAWTGAPTSGYALLIYGFDGGDLNFIMFEDGTADSPTPGGYTKNGFYNEVANAFTKFFYTGAPNPEPAEIELTKSGANQWTLGQTPDYDLELQVEYYEAHALKDIPAGWTVMVNGVEQQAPYQGDSLMIVETDSVTLVPAGNRRRVKSVTLEEEAQLQTVHVGGIVNATFYYLPGETWRQAIENHPTENAGFSINADKVRYNGTRVYIGSFGDLNPNTEVDPNGDYRALQH